MSGSLDQLDLGVVHDWIAPFGGAEKQLVQLAQMQPGLDIYTVFDFRGDNHEVDLGDARLHVSKLNNLPAVASYYRGLILLAARAVESFDLSQHDVVFSISSAVSKGVITHAEQSHIAYINSPPRYAWDLHAEYLELIGGPLAGLKRALAHEIFHRFRRWDMRTPNGVDLFLSNSKFIAERVWKTYRRRSHVLYPPVDTSGFQLNSGHREDYYVCASRMVPYKRMDLIAEAFAHMPDRKLVMIGDGPEMAKVKQVAGPNVEILGHQPIEAMRAHFASARGLIFAAKEDFGIVPVEAQASGTPVIAFGEGGAAETVLGRRDEVSPTGVFFEEQSVASLVDAIEYFEANRDNFTPDACRANALRFSNARFRDEVRYLVGAAANKGFREEDVLDAPHPAPLDMSSETLAAKPGEVE